eukprot:gene8692-11744_t
MTSIMLLAVVKKYHSLHKPSVLNWVNIKRTYSYKLRSTALLNESPSLDINLISTNPSLIISTLQARKADPELIKQVENVKELRIKRNNLIVEGDKARNIRKTVSKQIGISMKSNDEKRVLELKAEVETATKTAALADEQLVGVDNEIAKILQMLPNLLDDSQPSTTPSNQPSSTPSVQPVGVPSSQPSSNQVVNLWVVHLRVQ